MRSVRQREGRPEPPLKVVDVIPREVVRRRALANARKAAQVAVPDDCADALGNAAPDPAGEHPPAGVAAEIGLDQRFGDAAERDALQCERETRQQAAQQIELRFR
ncbi:MAG: hypothetical protein K0R41_2443 [Geminicoccaceae bacterium]|nr:hypothetical protein [Geminicoccaceae bacterium]